MQFSEPDPDAVEEPLVGGDVTDGVVRVGTTVRRPLKSQSAAIHAYLTHLHKSGFTAAPQFLGIDKKGREVLTFMEGQPASRPMPAWAGEEKFLVEIARLQRLLHDCSVGFELPPGVEWDGAPVIPGVPALFDKADTIGHNDLTPENIVCIDHVPVAFIDFDFAGPTTRLSDVSTAMYWWAPFRDPRDRDPLLRDVDSGRRARLYADSYGLDNADRQKLLDLAIRRCERSWHVMKYRAEHEGGGWARMWSEGVGDIIRRGELWLKENRATLESALLAG